MSRNKEIEVYGFKAFEGKLVTILTSIEEHFEDEDGETSIGYQAYSGYLSAIEGNFLFLANLDGEVNTSINMERIHVITTVQNEKPASENSELN